jgi:hypothetical protein
MVETSYYLDGGEKIEVIGKHIAMYRKRATVGTKTKKVT